MSSTPGITVTNSSLRVRTSRCAGAASKQDVTGLARQRPGTAQDQDPDQHGQQRIDRRPAGPEDHQRSDNGGDGAEKVAKRVQHRPFHIEVLALRAVQDGDCRQIYEQADDGNCEHRSCQNLHRLTQAVQRFIADRQRDEEESQTVAVGRQHLETMETVGAPPVGGTVRYAERQPSQGQRRRIGEHMAGIGQQRQRARQEAARRFHQHEPARQQRRPADPALIARVGVRSVAVVPMLVVPVRVLLMCAHVDRIALPASHIGPCGPPAYWRNPEPIQACAG